MNKQKYQNDINFRIDTDINKLLNKNVKKVKDILVLSGGSIKGISQIGALHCLKKNNMLNNIKNIAATSVGSMVGLLICVGYQPIELFKFMKLLNLSQLKKLNMQNIMTKYGLDDGTRIKLVLKKLINAKGYDSNITFKDFYKKTQINFIVTGACINDKKIHYFSHTEYPEMKVLDAIRISISIPLIFTPCVYEGKIFIDGGCIDNFPIHLFENDIDRVIGIYVSEYRQTVQDIKFLEDYLNNTIQCLFEGITFRDTLSYNKSVIKIKCLYNGESLTDVVSLFDDGYNAAQAKINTGDLNIK